MEGKILIADDETDIVVMLSQFFQGKGYRILTATNGVETLKQVENNPDIILLDINMPGMDGLEVCQRIRDYVSCPILFLTARIEDADKVKGFSVGGDDYMVCLVQMAQEKLLLCACSVIFRLPPLGKLLWMERIYPFLERDTAICWDICRSILDTILSLLLGIF